MSYLPKFNGNTPLLVVAGVVIVIIVAMTILTITGRTTPEVFAVTLSALITFLAGSAVAVQSRRNKGGDSNDSGEAQ